MFDSTPARLALLLGSLVGCASELSGTRQSPIDAAAPPTDVPTAVDRAAPTDHPAPEERTAPIDVTRPSAPLALNLTTNDFMPDGLGGSTDLFEDGEVWSEVCGGLAGQCESSLGRLPGDSMDVVSLRASMEATGLLAVPEGLYPPDADRERIVLRYVRGGRVFRWVINDLSVAPPPLRQSLERVQTALMRTVR